MMWIVCGLGKSQFCGQNGDSVGDDERSVEMALVDGMRPLQFRPCRFPTSILSSVPPLSFFPYFKTELIEVTVERGGSVDTGVGFWDHPFRSPHTSTSRMSVQMPKRSAKHLCAALCTLQFLGLSADLAQLQQRPPASNTTSKCS